MTSEDQQTIRAIVREEVTAVETRLAGYVGTSLDAVETRLTGYVDTSIKALEERSQEFARDLQTELITAFHDYARGQTAAIHRIQVSDADLAERLSARESRVLNLETRRPPQ